MTNAGEKIIGAFKYCAIVFTAGVRSGGTSILVKQLVFTDQSVFTMDAPGFEPSLKERLKPLITPVPNGKELWDKLKRTMKPTVDRSQKTVTKDMLKFGNYSMPYSGIKKVELFTDKSISAKFAVPDDTAIAFVGGFLDTSGFTVYVAADSVNTLKELIGETQLVELLPK